MVELFVGHFEVLDAVVVAEETLFGFGGRLLEIWLSGELVSV